jgi:carbamate kinase
MIIGKAIELFDGQEIVDLLAENNIVVAAGSLGVAVASLDAEGNLHLAIAENDLAKAKLLLKDYLA